MFEIKLTKSEGKIEILLNVLRPDIVDATF